jgi:hypothetical protein
LPNVQQMRSMDTKHGHQTQEQLEKNTTTKVKYRLAQLIEGWLLKVGQAKRLAKKWACARKSGWHAHCLHPTQL